MFNTNKKFIDEISKYGYDDLKLIYDTQQDLYTKEEMQYIESKLKEIEDHRGELGSSAVNTVNVKRKLPKKIKCPKCDQFSPFQSEKCIFCEYKFDKSKYYRNDYIYSPDDENLSSTEVSQSHAFQYIFSFLIPLIGFILGAILLSKDDEDERSVGKICIILGVISTIIGMVLAFATFK